MGKGRESRAHDTSPATGEGSHFTDHVESAENTVPVAERSDGEGSASHQGSAEQGAPGRQDT